MNPKGFSLLIWIVSIAQCFGQGNMNKLPVIDMHLHVYSKENYWIGDDLSVSSDKILTSPKTSEDHVNAVVDQMVKKNIVLFYASGNFEALDFLNRKYPGKFFPSIEIWPTQKLLGDAKYIETLKLKIENGDIKGIGEVLNFYNGIPPNDPLMDTLYKIAVKYDLPFGIHFGLAPSGSQLTLFPDMRIEFGNPLLLQDVLIKYPKLRLIIMHAGLTVFEDETFGIMDMFPNVYVDIGVLTWYNAHTRESVKEFLIKACKYGYTDRIMFGSDEMVWPESIGLSVDLIMNADFLTEDQKNDILYNNAAKFLRLSGKQ